MSTLTAEELAKIEAMAERAYRDTEGLHSSDYSAAMETSLEVDIPILLASHRAQAAEIERLTEEVRDLKIEIEEDARMCARTASLKEEK